MKIINALKNFVNEYRLAFKRGNALRNAPLKLQLAIVDEVARESVPLESALQGLCAGRISAREYYRVSQEVKVRIQGVLARHFD